MRTYVPKEGEITRDWVVMDAADQVLGRLATEAARILRGKHKPGFTPHLDTAPLPGQASVRDAITVGRQFVGRLVVSLALASPNGTATR